MAAADRHRAEWELQMSGSAGPKGNGQPAARPRRSSHARARRLAGVLSTALLMLASLIASAWVGISPAVATTTTAVWTNVTPASGNPPGVDYATMAYDPASSQVVLFGGQGSSGLLATTWVWDGTTNVWAELSPATSPPARYGAAMAYDPATSTLVLYGGANGSGGYLNDTWTWNGTTWANVTPSTGNPPGREQSSMAYDPSTSQVVLFGGHTYSNTTYTDSYFDDTWTWNGTTDTWANLTPSTGNPSGRGLASMAYDPDTSQLVLFGGVNGFENVLDDTWTWDGTAWTQLSPAASPSGRFSAAMAYDPSTSQLVLFGGGNIVPYLSDTWAWDGTTWTQVTTGAGPAARYGASMAYDPASSQLVLFGGNGGTVLNDTWTLAPPGIQASPTAGSVTTSASAAFTDQLVASEATGDVTFVTTSTACGVVVSAGGAVSTTGTLAAGSCTVSGTDSDTDSDTGTWSYALTITPVTVTQASPAGGTTTTTGSAGFTDQLAPASLNGNVTFVTSSTGCGVVVSEGGVVSTTGSLDAGSCTVSGTDSDVAGDTGTWTYTLAIGPVTITQVAPADGQVTPAGSAAFTAQLATTGQDPVTFATTPGTPCGVTVSTGGLVSTTGTLPAGACTVSGTDTDTAGDTAGTWTYTLTVSAVVITPRPVLTRAHALPGPPRRRRIGRGPVRDDVAVVRAGRLTGRGDHHPGSPRPGRVHRVGHRFRGRGGRDMDLHPEGRDGHHHPGQTLGRHHHDRRLAGLPGPVQDQRRPRPGPLPHHLTSLRGHRLGRRRDHHPGPPQGRPVHRLRHRCRHHRRPRPLDLHPHHHQPLFRRSLDLKRLRFALLLA
jgi:hypothetical protein